MGLHVHLDRVFLDNAKKIVNIHSFISTIIGSRDIKKEQLYH